VLVPLCGKSVDLGWLAGQGNSVVGVEISEIAIKAFFAEQEFGYSISDDELPRFQADNLDITIYCGDIFKLSSLQCDAHYDRGALIAMPAAMRPAYAAHVSSLLTADAEQLVITLNYDDEVANGPPFHVADAELLGYWPRLSCVETREDIENGPPKFLEAGLTSLQEKVWRSA
jgi:thiopurine S-methyltransferase